MGNLRKQSPFDRDPVYEAGADEFAGIRDPIGTGVTPAYSDTVPIVDAAAMRALWVGAAGNVGVEWADGRQSVIAAVPAGTLLPFRVRKILVTGTTVGAGLIVVLS